MNSINDKIRSLLNNELSEAEIEHAEVVRILDKEIKMAVGRGFKKCARKGLPSDLTDMLWVFATCMAQAAKAYNATTDGRPVQRELLEKLVEHALDAEFMGEEAALLAQWDHRHEDSN